MSIAKEVPFYAIPVEIFRPSVRHEFNLYVKKNQNFEVIVEKNTPYPAKLNDFITHNANDQRALYISLAEKDIYYNYLESYLKNISNDKSVPLREKSALIYKSASGVIDDLLKNPESKEALKRIKNLVDSTINIILQNDTSIKNLMSIGSYDYYTYTHSVDVSIFTIGFANYLNFSFESIRDIGYAAMMHDVGKSKIPNDIINKNGVLTQSEFEVIQKHPSLGFDILKFHNESKESVLMGVRSHHEKARGNGYPDNLKSSQIHDFAKIITLADIFGALTTKRSYKDAFSSFEALKLMKQEMIEDFDSTLFFDFVRFIGKSCTQ